MAEREFRTTPQWPIATTPLSGDELVEVWKGGKQYYVPFSELGGMPAAHSGTHKHGGDDEVGTLDNLAYGIPKLDADGLIDSRVSDASTTTKGKVQLATDGEENAIKPPTSTDSRLKDARPPTAHAAQHIAGTDVIDDATVSNSGLMSAADKVKADATTPAYIPTADQKAALAGTEGTASGTNKYVTDEDGRLPTVGEKAALPGTSGTPGAANKYVTNSDGRLPTAGEKAALVGSYGTPSATNKYVTESDPVLSSAGGGGGTTGPDLLGISEASTISDVYSDTIITGLSETSFCGYYWYSSILSFYEWDGFGWYREGNNFTVTGAGLASITKISTNAIAFIDNVLKSLRTYTWDGTDWSLTGNSLSIPTLSNATIKRFDTNKIALADTGTNTLTTYSWDGTDWAKIGNSLSIAGTGRFEIADLSETEIALINLGVGDLQTISWDGTDWSLTGDALSIGVLEGRAGMDSFNSSDIVLAGETSEKLTFFRWNGSGWLNLQKTFAIPGLVHPSLFVDENLKVVLYNRNIADDIAHYYVLFGYDTASVNVQDDFEAPEIATGKSIVIRRTSAYDGNPVTISPPSGATFEGRASLSLYGQYSFVELERISETVFAVKDFYDRFKYIPTSGITNLPGTWTTAGDNYGLCTRRKGFVSISQSYIASGAATGPIELPITSLVPSGISVIPRQPRTVSCLDIAPTSIWGGVYASTNFGGFTTTAGVSWSQTVPFVWAAGDSIFFTVEYTTES